MFSGNHYRHRHSANRAVLTARKFWLRCGSLFLALCCAIHPVNAFSQQAERFTVQAALLQKITLLIAWPNSALSNVKNINLCVLGTKKSQRLFEQIYQNVVFYGKPANVFLFDRRTAAGKCHILYFEQGFEKEAAQFARNNVGKPLLMVGSDEGLAEQGIHLNFIVNKGKIAFELNRQAMAASGFKLNPQLLKYAKVVGQ